jgi:ferrous iron transport protein B
VTVGGRKKEAVVILTGRDIKVGRPAGVYSLTAYSPDEVVARNFIIEEKPDVVVDIVDASNLERNLYLAVQIMEMGVPMILALNMMDEAEAKHYKIDVAAISREMGVPVVPMVANRNKGTLDLLGKIVEVAGEKEKAIGVRIEYDREVEQQISRLEKEISTSPLSADYAPRWLAIKLIEGDAEVLRSSRR